MKRTVGKKIVALSLILLFATGCSHKDNSENSISKNNDIFDSTSNVDDIIESTISNNIDDETTEKSENTEESQNRVVNPVIVDVQNSNGEIYRSEYNSMSEINLERPNELKVYEVFTGWKESEVISSIGENLLSEDNKISLTAESVNISGMENAIYNDAVYINNDIPSEFSIPVRIGGNTNFCVLDLEIEYDSSLLEFLSFENVDADVECNCVVDESKIYISFISLENINADLDFCDIKFKTVSKDKCETALTFDVADIAAWNDNKSDVGDVRCNVVAGKIVMY